MTANEYVEQIRKAYRAEDLEEVERLRAIHGQKFVSFNELEEVVSYDTGKLLELIDELTEFVILTIEQNELKIPTENTNTKGEMTND